jgi:hypothetical protein
VRAGDEDLDSLGLVEDRMMMVVASCAAYSDEGAVVKGPGEVVTKLGERQGGGVAEG